MKATEGQISLVTLTKSFSFIQIRYKNSLGTKIFTYDQYEYIYFDNEFMSLPSKSYESSLSCS